MKPPNRILEAKQHIQKPSEALTYSELLLGSLVVPKKTTLWLLNQQRGLCEIYFQPGAMRMAFLERLRIITTAKNLRLQ